MDLNKLQAVPIKQIKMLKTDINTYMIFKTKIIKNEKENLTSLTVFNLGKTTVTYNDTFEITPTMGVNGIELINSKINPVRTKNIKLSFSDDKDTENKVLVSVSTLNKTCN